VPTCLPGSDGRSRSDAAPCLYGFHGELIGLAQRLDVAALAGHHASNIKRSKAKISHHFDHVKIEKARASLCVSHRSFRFRGGHSLCTAQ